MSLNEVGIINVLGRSPASVQCGITNAVTGDAGAITSYVSFPLTVSLTRIDSTTAGSLSAPIGITP